MEAFRGDPRPGDLGDELAMMRALLQDYLDTFKDGFPMEPSEVERIYDMLSDVGRLVERIARIRNQTALTVAEVTYLQARIADLVGRYVPEAKQPQFLAELEASIDGEGGETWD